MAINGFKFPGVELTTKFVQTPVTGESELGVVIVGPQYKTSTVVDVAITAGTAATPTVINLPVAEGTIDQTSSLSKITVNDALFKNYVAETSGNGSIKIVAGTVSAAGDSADITFNEPLATGTPSKTAFGYLPPTVDGTVDVMLSGSTAANKAIITSVVGSRLSVVFDSGSVSLAGGTVTSVAFYSMTNAEFSGESAITSQTSQSMTLVAAPTVVPPGKEQAVYSLVFADYFAVGIYDVFVPVCVVFGFFEECSYQSSERSCACSVMGFC